MSTNPPLFPSSDVWCPKLFFFHKSYLSNAIQLLSGASYETLSVIVLIMHNTEFVLIDDDFICLFPDTNEIGHSFVTSAAFLNNLQFPSLSPIRRHWTQRKEETCARQQCTAVKTRHEGPPKNCTSSICYYEKPKLTAGLVCTLVIVINATSSD